MNSSPISNCRHSTLAILFSHNVDYNINSLLQLRVEMHIIYMYISNKRNIQEVEMKTKRP